MMTQSSDVFRSMTDEECTALLTEMRDDVRPLYKQVENMAASTLRLRPVFLGKQPFPKRCQMIRKALALKVNSEGSGEVLAAFFLEKHAEDVSALLDAFGIEHEEGALKDSAPAQPDAKKVKKVAADFVKGDKAVIRGVLLKAFAAQSAIDWPDLDAIVFPAAEKVEAK
jgi:hypothetical protein